MALKEFYIGSVGPLYHDDVTSPTAFSSDAPISPGQGTDASHAALIGDVSGTYPVNSVFVAIVATDPGTLLGFGTWASVGTLVVGGTTTYFSVRTA
jgi:hypothetical protein